MSAPTTTTKPTPTHADRARDGSALLEVRDVTKIYGGGGFFTKAPSVLALEDFSLTLPATRSTIVTIAGESGSGKTTLANLVLGFIVPTSGQILYKGRDIHAMSKADFKQYRREVQAIFQDPYEVYNPFYRVDSVFNIIIRKFGLASSRDEARHMTEQALEVVGLRPGEVLGKYPHELSGGQRQRVMVARAFLLKPRLIVADEPVSMVDASLRGMILEIMIDLKERFGISFLYISHDLSTAYQLSDEIYILYQGSVAERGDIDKVIKMPQHPYTQMLIGSIPLPDPDRKWTTRVEMLIDENNQALAAKGCKFRNRCPHAMDICATARPPLYAISTNHVAACYLYRDRETVASD